MRDSSTSQSINKIYISSNKSYDQLSSNSYLHSSRRNRTLHYQLGLWRRSQRNRRHSSPHLHVSANVHCNRECNGFLRAFSDRYEIAEYRHLRSEERRVGKECRSARSREV